MRASLSLSPPSLGSVGSWLRATAVLGAWFLSSPPSSARAPIFQVACGARPLLQLCCHVQATGRRGTGRRYTAATPDPPRHSTSCNYLADWNLVVWTPHLGGRPGNVDLLVYLLFRVGRIGTPSRTGLLLLRNKGKWLSGRYWQSLWSRTFVTHL